MNGAEAHAQGVPLADCPFAPADPDGALWRAEWIRAEATVRANLGTFGATDEDYRSAGLVPPARTEAGHPVLVLHLSPEQVQALTRAAQILGDGFKALCRKLAAVDWSAIVADLEKIGVLTPSSPPPPTGNHRPCPRHGPTRSGNCAPCQREMTRRHGRR